MHIILKVMHTIFFIIIPSLIPHAVFEEDVGSSGSRALDAPGMSDPPAKKSGVSSGYRAVVFDILAFTGRRLSGQRLD